MAKNSENRRNVAQAFISAAQESTARAKREHEQRVEEKRSEQPQQKEEMPEKQKAQRKEPDLVKSERVTIRLTKRQREALENMAEKKSIELGRLAGFAPKVTMSNVLEEIINKYLEDNEV